jgi:hypothetical protein
MGKDIKTVRGGGIWGWIKRGFVAVAKSGAASETWKLVQPVVLGMIGAAITTLIGLAQRAPGLAIAGVAAFVFLAVAIGWAKVQAVRANRQQPAPEQVAPPPESEADRLYRLKLAELEAEDRIRRERATRRIFGLDIGAAFADVMEEREADRKAEAEARRQRMIREASLPPPPPPAPKFDMTLRAVLERIAFESEWAVTRNWNSPRDQWQETMWEVPLGKELLRPLASGDIPSRGIRSGEDGDEHGHSDIPPQFWRNPKLKPHADQLLLEPEYDYVGEFGVGPTYHDIRLRSVDVNEIWPARSPEEIEAKPSPFVAWAAEWKAAFEDRLLNSQMEYEELRARAQPDKRIRFSALRVMATEYAIPLERFGERQNTGYGLERALKTAAANGELAVWGRPYQGKTRDNDPLVPIPAEHFRKYSFRHGSFDFETENKTIHTTTIDLIVANEPEKAGETYYDLRVSERGARKVLAAFALLSPDHQQGWADEE